MDKQMTLAFSKVVELAHSLNVVDINKLPGAWEHRVDQHWQIAVNGHDHEIEVEPAGTMGAKIPPFEVAVWWNGWLAGLIGPFDGILAAGEGANEDTFIAAIDEAMEAAQRAVAKMEAERE